MEGARLARRIVGSDNLVKHSLPRAGLFSGAAALVTVTIGAFGLATWRLDQWRIATFGSGYIPMAPLTAALFVVLGLAVYARIRREDSAAVRSGAAIVAVVTAVIAGLSLLQAWGAFPLPWDDWMVSPLARAGALPVGRVSPLTAIVFLFSALALLAGSRRLERHPVARWISPAAAVMGIAIALVVILSYAAGAPVLYGGPSVPMALLTAIAFVFLDSGLLAFGTEGELLLDRRDEASVPGERRGGRTADPALLALGVLAAISIVLVGFYFLRGKVVAARDLVRDQLEAIASLKSQQVSDWRDDRLSEARILLQTSAVASDLAEFVTRPDSPKSRDRARGWMEPVRRARYDSVLVFNARAELLLSIPDSLDQGDRTPRPELERAFRSKDPIFGELRREEGGKALLDLLVPIHPPQGSVKALAVIVLRLDADRRLFPLVGTWPVRSTSAEALLVRRDGDAVVHLTPLRHSTQVGELRLSANDPSLTSAIALGGDPGVDEGLDYRGAPTLFASRPIKDSPWVLVAKIDRAEAFGPVRREAWLGGTLIAMLLLIVGQTGIFAWRQRHAEFLRRALVAELQHQAVSERLALITRHANDVVLLFDERMRIVEANDRVAEVYGRTPQEMCLMTARDLGPAEAVAGTSAKDFAAGSEADGEGRVYETMHQRRDGAVFPVEVSARPVNIGGSRYIFATIREISERKAHETEIERLNQLFAALTHVNQAIVHATERGAFLQEVCRSLVQFGGFPIAWVGWRDPKTSVVLPIAKWGDTSGYVDKIRAQADLGTHGHGPTTIAIRENRAAVRNDFMNDPGTEPWREAAALAGIRASIALPIRSGGAPAGTLNVYASQPGFFRAREVSLLEETAADVAFGIENLDREARRQEADTALRASLNEKEALLKEVHHRVKNNLQVIMSLLRLEGGRTAAEATKLVLRDMQGRIRSMALLHEALYRSGNYARVDLAEYLRDLVTQLFRAQSVDPAGVRLVLDLSRVRLDIDRAIPCGLIVNELVTNSLKHAFASGRQGEVSVSLERDSSGRARLSVSDTGPGLPEDFDARRSKSLGMQLVGDLSRQLGGQLEIRPGPGASFSVIFPAPDGFDIEQEDQPAGRGI